MGSSEVWGWRPHGVPQDLGDKAAFSATGNLGDRLIEETKNPRSLFPLDREDELIDREARLGQVSTGTQQLAAPALAACFACMEVQL